MTGAPRDPWALLGHSTPARIAIGRAGASLPTREVLSFALAHAQARDAVHARLDREAMATRLRTRGLRVVEVESEARDRAVYLRRPDLGRRLDAASGERIRAAIGEDNGTTEAGIDLALAIGDGLSATAVALHATSFVEALLPHIAKLGLRLGPVAIAEGARVALGDEIGQRLGARVVAVLIGERPGLSAADSMSVYLTYAPRPGRTDAERNCVSNVRPGGLAPNDAAAKVAWLIERALALGLTGVALKDESDAAALDSGATSATPVAMLDPATGSR